ncbi:MAG: hypothetical protein K1X78_20340 [Verrucomicrobiaceae bacterium]|nr:hypothetical protein [Verrucomicrobiaceae bacterium]
MKTTSNPIENDLTALNEMCQAAPAPLNPEDLTAFAITSDFNQGAAKKVLTTVPVRKPLKETFIRTHLDPECWQLFGLLELKEAGRMYLVTPAVAAALREESEATLIMAHLVLCVDRRGNPFLWPLKVSERECDWHNSARLAAELAKTQWVRVTSNMSAGCYDSMVAVSQAGQPAWPSESYKALLSLAFSGRVISSLDHAVLKELRGH